jgi:hypothetical protein
LPRPRNQLLGADRSLSARARYLVFAQELGEDAARILATTVAGLVPAISRPYVERIAFPVKLDMCS